MKQLTERLRKILDSPADYDIEDPEFKEFSEAAYNYALEMTERELKQAVEGLYHNLNTLQSRSGNQLPFSSINYGTCTFPEGRMVTEAILKGSISGTGKLHLTPIFPCGIFQCKTGVNRKEGDPNYDLFKLALESTSKRLYPNYANCDAPQQKAAIKQDIEVRQKVIDNLPINEYNKLYKKLQENDELNLLLGTYLEGDKILTKEINDPRCELSTMGKRKLQPI